MSSTCDIDCTLAVCGDDMVNAMAGEECDTAGSSASCDEDCTVARCGDGLLNPAAGERCDDGNLVAGDGCNADCRTNGICGNGTLDTGELPVSVHDTNLRSTHAAGTAIVDVVCAEP